MNESAKQPKPTLRVVMAQRDMLVGDVAGNTQKVIDAAIQARDVHQGDVIVLPELALTGYPPEDLLLRHDFQRQVDEGIEAICQQVQGIHVVVGHPIQEREGRYNAASVIRDGQVVHRYRKHHIPNYSVFDEKRYFAAGSEPCVVDIRGVPVAVTICEDIWHPGPVGEARQAGARLTLNLNASPFSAGKQEEREAVLRKRLQEGRMPFVYLNLVGGQDELVFDGESFVMDADGRVVQREAPFEEGLFPVDFDLDDELTPRPGRCRTPLPVAESLYQAIVLGVRDYMNKNRFNGAVVGLSGGIDSALTLAVAVDALGAERVEAVMMPSRYSADMSLEDAKRQAEALGVEHRTIPIEPAFKAFLGMLEEEFAGLPVDTTEENIQARCRGIILMAVSNKKHKIVLTTGNKSEMAVGYATLYGDMAGGFAPLKDVPKTMVYRLAEYRNGVSPVIPERVLTRPPSAELAPDQKDEDSLPPYGVLDPILEMYIEQDLEPAQIVASGYDEPTVLRVIRMVNVNEYKRRQAPPGVRLTRRAFGRDRRYPITSAYLGKTRKE